MTLSQEALKMLNNTKRELKEDLTVKVPPAPPADLHLPVFQAVSLVIDRQKCMAMRLNFPYHNR